MGRERRRNKHPFPLQMPARLPGLYSFTVSLKVAEANNALALKKGPGRKGDKYFRTVN